ncbi:unnamed protein product [Penicillium salamii]|uniref:Pheromone-regulated membrane protein n=1 Tax=Penicillium salamii TaxID=1612424 RepID=A0A9W4NIQ0_9EURO|nr:unnamed protein product [Penicillium salamii]CAG8022550.1 unnamed protein product [Penicillium salamii]CAG8119193.1 unnamed protein product [Penicillium salamii]CAG8145116.1 unnamed protein product [Penicillium salamii]CAG8335879.1 unnamed protein product [Penicillium salamii]
MLCSGDREKGDVAMEEKWDYVNLDDFKSESCWTPFSYFFLWVFFIISLAVYGVDTFTAVNLLAFSRWSGRVEPAIPFNISRWIFAACIIASFVLLAYRWFHAIRAIRSGSITRSFLDPLAVRVQSIRFGEKGRGYRRFLVFAELTKDRKAAEYVALYAYFSFQFWMNTIFADGPRQVINAITLYSVMQMDLIPGGKNAAHDDGSSSVGQFFNNVKILAEDNNLQAVVLFGMLFTLIIWVLSVLKLISAIVLYLIFLFHHIPAEDGTLSRYCRRKVGQRLKRIVHRKNNKALAKGLKLQNRVPTQPSLAAFDTKPTLPAFAGDKGPAVATISRSTTQTTLPPYSRSNSTAPSSHNPTLPNLDFEKPPLARTATSSSAVSESASASLTGNAAGMGYSPIDSQRPTLPPVPPLPANVPQRMATPHYRATPALYSHEGDYNSTGAGYRNLTDSGSDSHSRPYQSYTPAPEYGSTDVGSSEDYDGDYDYFNRTHEPAHYDPYASRTTPHPNPQSDYYHQDPYSARSYTPASTGATPAPYRTDTPASYRPAPPSASVQQPPRTFTPMTSATPAPQTGGYTAFNPSMSYQSAQSHSQRPPAPDSYNRAHTVSPSAMHRAPPGHSFNRANTHQY